MTDTKSYQQGYIAGVLYGDGYYYDWLDRGVCRYRRAEVKATDVEMISTVAKFARNLFGIKAYAHGPFPVSLPSRKPYWQWKTSNPKFVLRMEHWSPIECEEWRGFIGGLFDAEGCFTKRRIVIGMKNTPQNVHLLRAISKQLEKLELFSQLHLWKNGKHEPAVHLELRVFKRSHDIFKYPLAKRRLLKQKVIDKFFAIFQPKIQRKQIETIKSAP